MADGATKMEYDEGATMQVKHSPAATDIDTISNVIKSPPPSARSWPPAIDAQALGPIEQARMKAEDNKRIQERMALQAIIAQMPAGPDSTSTEESMASKKKPSDWKNGNKNTITEANPSST